MRCRGARRRTRVANEAGFFLRNSEELLHRQCALLVGAADAGGLLTMTGDDAHPLVELLRDRLGRAGLEKGDTVLAAGGEHLVARLLHLRGVGAARHLAIAERKGEIARPQLGKADPGDAEDLLAACDPFRAFELDAEQQFAPLAERPGVAELAVFRFRDAPDRRRARFRAAAARAETERLCLAGVGAVPVRDRKSTRLNSSHSQISYAVFCLKKKK